MALALSQRERRIAIAMIAVLGICVLYLLVISPYFDARDSVAQEKLKYTQQMAEAANLLAKEKKLKPIWTTIQQGGLKTDSSQAESQIWHAVLSWAQQAGVNVGALKSERTTTEGKFQVIGIHVTGTGSTTAISRMLWGMETASIPVRINDIQIRPRKDNTDDLTIEMSVSTLCVTNSTASKTVSLASGSGQ